MLALPLGSCCTEFRKQLPAEEVLAVLGMGLPSVSVCLEAIPCMGRPAHAAGQTRSWSCLIAGSYWDLAASRRVLHEIWSCSSSKHPQHCSTVLLLKYCILVPVLKFHLKLLLWETFGLYLHLVPLVA